MEINEKFDPKNEFPISEQLNYIKEQQRRILKDPKALISEYAMLLDIEKTLVKSTRSIKVSFSAKFLDKLKEDADKHLSEMMAYNHDKQVAELEEKKRQALEVAKFHEDQAAKAKHTVEAYEGELKALCNP